MLAAPVDALVAAAFLEAVTPAEADAFERAEVTRSESEAALRRAAAQQVERLRYRALLAERQFDKVDPDNRLVAAELERRWEAALCELRAAETALAAQERAGGDPEAAEGPTIAASSTLRMQLLEIQRSLPPLWADPRLTPAQRKAWDCPALVDGWGAWLITDALRRLGPPPVRKRWESDIPARSAGVSGCTSLRRS